jgi:exo-1,4-beta-D-glucosaminidase
MGEPNLHKLYLEVASEEKISDSELVTFGIRHIEDYLTEEGYRGYRINGKPLLIRGGGWVDELMLADTDQRIEDQILYAKHMNLNTIRLEGFWGSSQRLFDLADEHGVLVMVGWSCQWEWEEYLEGPVDEYGGIDTPMEIDLVARSLRDQVLWLRNHPSVFVWVLASDMLPRPELESRYLEELAKIDTSRPTLAACATDVSEVSGPSGVKMNGPYDWVPPIYWFIDTEHGGAYGFNTETGPGPQPPPLESLQRMLPEDHWWPVDEMWNFHSGRNQFHTIENYHAALDARYGETTDLEDFARKAQLANYEGMRAMFEAFSIRRPKTTGLIQWMLNSAWPELYWQLYDYYLVPNGAFYGAQDAARPINIALDRADRGIVAINETATSVEGVTARIRVLDFGSEVLHDESLEIELPAESIERLLELPPVSAEGGAYFLDLRLTDSVGDTLVSSLYWLSTVDDELDWEASEWYYTPTSRYADFTGLTDLPEVNLEVDHRFVDNDEGQTVHVTLENPSDKLAFFVELSVVGADSGQLLTPIFWSENYVSLLPGERREVSARIPTHALGDQTPVFRYQGINVAPGP